ncbi:MAG TPA: TMEM165/GDT1 family protein, partial [Candidatus Dormibacteraeota bacterium]
TVFLVVFLVELPDKTALATVLLATRNRPLPVFAGVALAFVIQTVVAVFAGSLIALLPHQLVRIGAGLLFIAMAVVVAWRTRRAQVAADAGQLPGPSRGRQRPFITAFSMIMLAEWGDLSQLATVAFQARYNQAVLVFVSATLALWAVTALAVLIGNRLGGLLPERPVQYAAAALMVVIGIVLISGRIG